GKASPRPSFGLCSSSGSAPLRLCVRPFFARGRRLPHRWPSRGRSGAPLPRCTPAAGWFTMVPARNPVSDGAPMIEPRPAPVKPRATAPASRVAAPLEDEVASFLEAGAAGVIEVQGPPGYGKTTTLRHLAALLPATDRLRYADEPTPTELLALPPGCLVVC